MTHSKHSKHIDTSPRFIAVDLQRQLLPGTSGVRLVLAEDPPPKTSL